MMLAKYNKYVDKFLWEIVGDNVIDCNDMNVIVDLIATAISQFDDINLRNLKRVVKILLLQKHKRVFVYDKTSPLNKFQNCCELDGDYVNSEIPEPNNEIETIDELINHNHEYNHRKYKEKCYKYRKQRVEYIKTLPQHEQKSQEWLNQRRECLTATAVSTALDEDPYKYPGELLLDKCGRGPPFLENKFVHHGKKYEEIGNMFYGFRNNVKVEEYGLVQHDKYRFIGASPDGICDSDRYDNCGLSRLVGRMLEIKFPFSRKINTTGDLNGDICPHYYYLQVQTQLFVAELQECDFLQCKIEEYNNYKEYLDDTHEKFPGISKATNLERGAIIQLFPRNKLGVYDPKIDSKKASDEENECLYAASYIYPPKLHMTLEEIQQWIYDFTANFPESDYYKTHIIDRVIYWRLSKVACHLIVAETDWFISIIPTLRKFWDYVLFFRENKLLLDKIEKYIKEVGPNKTSYIFKKCHKYYKQLNPDKDIGEPLYQVQNKWRKKYEAKKAYWDNYNKNKK